MTARPSTPSSTSARTRPSHSPRGRSRATRSSAGCTARASTSAPASPSTSRPPSRSRPTPRPSTATPFSSTSRQQELKPHDHPGHQGPARLGQHRRRRDRDPQGRRPHGQHRRGARHHGPERLGQVHAGLLDRRPPEVQDHQGLGDARRPGHPRHDRRRARPRRPLPRDAVPGRGSRCFRRELPAHGQDGARWRSAEAAHVGQGGQRRARGRRPRPHVRAAQCQRRLLRRREEAPRDRAARAAQPQVRSARRDRLRPRHRRPARRGRRRQPLHVAARQGTAADHALHADPAVHQARLRARLRRRPGRRAGRTRAGRPARGRGLRQVREGSRRRMTTVSDAAQGPAPPIGRLRRRQDQGRLPDPGPSHGRGPAARVSRQRQHLPEADGGHRRARRALPAAQRQRRPRHAPARRRGHRGVRGRPHQGRLVHRREPSRRSRLHEERVRGAQPRGPRARRRRHGQ